MNISFLEIKAFLKETEMIYLDPKKMDQIKKEAFRFSIFSG